VRSYSIFRVSTSKCRRRIGSMCVCMKVNFRTKKGPKTDI